jgi:hypothetical protein
VSDSNEHSTIEAFLRERTDVIEPMFEQLNLRLLGFGYRVVGDNHWMILDFEVAAIEGTSLRVPEGSVGVQVKASLYDASGNMLCSSEGHVSVNNFMGYDTGHILFYTDGIALAADKARIFAARW